MRPPAAGDTFPLRPMTAERPTAGDEPARSPTRCDWCAQAGGDLETVRARVPDQLALSRTRVELHAHSRHVRLLRRYLARFRRDGRRFALAVLGMILVPIAFYALLHAAAPSEAVRARWEELFLGPYLMAVGATFAAFPFATPLTNRLFGIRTSIRIVRAAGLLFVGFGVYWLAVALL